MMMRPIDRFVLSDGITPRAVRPHDLFADDDPLVILHRWAFEPAGPTIEQATRAPGERRAATKAKR